MAKHARLSASGSKQWINCPGSIQKEQDYPQGGSSIFAQQGTAGHHLADYCLTTGTDAADHVGTRIYVYDGNDEKKKDTVAVPARVEEGGALEERLVAEGYTRFEVVDGEGNGESVEVKAWAVQMFVDKVRREYEKTVGALELLGEKAPPLTTEEYMDGSAIHALMGGTADANFLGFDNWIKLFDLKFGAGVSVEVEDNTQLKIYAVLILMILMGRGHEPDGVDMYIVQPRLEHADGPIRHARYTRQELLDFRDELRGLAEATQRRNAPTNAGDWCLWCKAKIDCDAFRERTQEVARMEFDDPPDHIVAPTDLDQLAKIAAWMPMIDALFRDVNGAIGRELHQGRAVEGFKLVRMKTNRRFGRPDDHPEGLWAKGDEVAPEVIEEVMRSEGLLSRKEMYHPPKMLTLPQMEKLGKDAKLALRQLTFKPEGRLTVAPSSDPREEVKVDVSVTFPDADDAMEIPT